VLRTADDTFRFYVELGPDGRRLGEPEATATKERLAQGASCGRVLDVERRCRTVRADEAELVLATLGVLRAMQRSMVLALSDDGYERARAMAVSQLKTRMQPVQARWLASGPGGQAPGG